MEKILNVMRVLDSFGVVYNFRYRDKKKYKTALGGFFLILFLVLVFVYVEKMILWKDQIIKLKIKKVLML